jgi:hypothetical protein
MRHQQLVEGGVSFENEPYFTPQPLYPRCNLVYDCNGAWGFGSLGGTMTRRTSLLEI